MGGVTYFERDFDFDEHAREVEATWDPRVGGGPAPSQSVRALDDGEPGWGENLGTGDDHRQDARRPSAADDVSTTSAAQASAWDAFHGTHDSGVFFKERRYLLAEFPKLCDPDVVKSVLEVGCGSGSSALPVLAANPRATVLACDWSANAVRCATRAVERAKGVESKDRFEGFVSDPSTSDDLAGEVHRRLTRRGLNHGLDAVLMVFVLSAVPPGEGTASFLRRCVAALRPGGVVCFRDYGLYDLPMLRFPPNQRVGERTYVRQDGTLARFFTLDEVRVMFKDAGLVEEVVAAGGDTTTREPVRYCCVHNENKKKGIKMRRVFVHGVWKKPLG